MSDERRSAPRKPATVSIDVIDSISGEPMGRIGNLSRTGIMLICRQPLHDGALYQLRFQLPGPGGGTEIETGVHTMWTDDAATNGYQWAGLRIISISNAVAQVLDQWLEQDTA